MTDNNLPEKYAHDPKRYRLLESGAIYDNQLGHIVANPGGGKYAITAESNAEFHARKKQIGLIAQMRGLALGYGVELPEDAELEQLAQAAGDAIVAIYAHTVKTYLASKNIRGMGEIIPKLVAGFIETDSRNRAENDSPANVPVVVVAILEYINSLKEKENALEGKILE